MGFINFWRKKVMLPHPVLVYVWIWLQFGQIWPKYSKFRSNLTNVVLTTNGHLASVALALDALRVSEFNKSIQFSWIESE